MRRTVFATAGLLVVVAAVAGCSHSTGGANDGGNGAAGAVLRAGAPVPSAANQPMVHQVDQAAGRADAAAVANLQQRQEIRTADMTVAVKSRDQVAQQADAAVAITARSGGEVTEDDRISGRHAYATLVLRVPPARLEPTLQALSRLGVEKSRRLSTVDVTSRVADVASRVASARAAIAQLRTLYRQASKIRDLIEVEAQLASREADLESLEARQRALANQVALATITLHLVPAAKHHAKPAPAKHYSGFVGGLERGWHAFSTAVAWLAVAVGAVLPFLVLALVIALLTWQLRRRLRPRSPDPSP